MNASSAEVKHLQQKKICAMTSLFSCTPQAHDASCGKQKGELDMDKELDMALLEAAKELASERIDSE